MKILKFRFVKQLLYIILKREIFKIIKLYVKLVQTFILKIKKVKKIIGFELQTVRSICCGLIFINLFELKMARRTKANLHFKVISLQSTWTSKINWLVMLLAMQQSFSEPKYYFSTNKILFRMSNQNPHA